MVWPRVMKMLPVAHIAVLSWCRRQFLAEHLQISPAERSIGFQVVPFSPFVPGLDEDDAVFSRHAAHAIERPPHVTAEQLGRRSMEDGSVCSAPGRVIPVGDQARKILYAGNPIENQGIDDVFIEMHRR